MRTRNVGVTLFEIMLVLAVSVSIIVMSIRYYGSTVASHQANATMEQIMVISATVDRVKSSGASYQNILGALQNMLPPNSLTTAWNTQVSFEDIRANSYAVVLSGMPASVCSQVSNELNANGHFHVTSACERQATDFKYTYSL